MLTSRIKQQQQQNKTETRSYNTERCTLATLNYNNLERAFQKIMTTKRKTSISREKCVRSNRQRNFFYNIVFY